MITETRTRISTTHLGTPEYVQGTAGMNDVSESRNVEAGNRKSILSTRSLLRIRCWNVRPMYETGKQAQVLKEMKNYKLHILGISECRWTGF